MRKFKVGDYAVHISHGVGIVKGIERREFSLNKSVEFYIMEIQDCGTPKKVFVPVDAANTRMRHLVTRAEAERVLAHIVAGVPKGEYSLTWNRRYREFMERLHTGNLQDIAEVYVSIKKLSETADLSFGERKLLQQAKTLISKEFEAVELTLPE